MVELQDGAATVVFESSGGTARTDDARNLDHVPGLDLLLGRMAKIGIELDNAIVDSKTTRSLPVSEKRLDPGQGLTFPVELRSTDLDSLRKNLLRSSAQIGRSSGRGAGGGNSRKRLRLILGGQPLQLRDLADVLATGRPNALRHGLDASAESRLDVDRLA